ncbi:MAG: acetyl-CoA carboxylase biotin carboxyl carrier protein [Sedimentisphaerales bacterium]|nr:acetyl-CoA carboxylase biotin carboxyl carrier protein [Sedimentisphaerales bacterium]
MADKDADLKRIKRLIKIMEENGLVEVEIQHGDDKIALKRAQPQTIIGHPFAGVAAIGQGSAGVVSATNGRDASARTDQAASAGADEDLAEIKSPIVGTFYATPSPDSEDYVEVGSRVEPQTVVCIIEAMKVMNEIKAEISGTISEILVSNGQAVEYGQVLFRVKAD